MSRHLFVTRSRRLDAVVIVALALLVLAGATRLRVYYQITVTEVELLAVAEDGSQAPVAAPVRCTARGATTDGVEPTLDLVKRQLTTCEVEVAVPAGGRLVWVIRYSHNSSDVDQQQIIQFGNLASP